MTRRPMVLLSTAERQPNETPLLGPRLHLPTGSAGGQVIFKD